MSKVQRPVLPMGLGAIDALMGALGLVRVTEDPLDDERGALISADMQCDDWTECSKPHTLDKP